MWLLRVREYQICEFLHLQIQSSNYAPAFQKIDKKDTIFKTDIDLLFNKDYIELHFLPAHFWQNPIIFHSLPTHYSQASDAPGRGVRAGWAGWAFAHPLFGQDYT